MLLSDAVMIAADISCGICNQGMDPGHDLYCRFSQTGYQPFMTRPGRSIQKALRPPPMSMNQDPCRLGFAPQGPALFVTDSGCQPHRDRPGLNPRGFLGHRQLGLHRHFAVALVGFESNKVGVAHLDKPEPVGNSCPGRRWPGKPCGPWPHGLVVLDLQQRL
jgi:hypothetical protein